MACAANGAVAGKVTGLLDSDDVALVQQLVAGDGQAWALFVRHYQRLVQDRVRCTLVECGKSSKPTDIEDVTAEVFSQLLANDCRSLRGFQGRSRLSTWLSVIARRTCLTHLRQASRRAAQIWAEPVTESIADEQSAADGGLSDLIRREDAQRLRDTLRRLNEGDQQILRMFYLESLGYAEISRRLAISTNAVGPKLHRAQKRLRRLLLDSADLPGGRAHHQRDSAAEYDPE